MISTISMVSRRISTRKAVVALIGAGAALLAACGSSSSTPTTTSSTSPAVSVQSLQNWPTSAIQLTESGSSLLYPVFNNWVTSIKQRHPTITIQTASTGSGKGISDAATGTANIGASDAYLSNSELDQYPGLLNIPLAISAQQVNYNIPGLSIPNGGHLKLTGTILSDIYLGKITNWDDSQIKSINPGATIPSVPIVTVHRAESSGDTFLFTSFLAATDPSGWGQKIPPGTTVAWPNVPGAVSATGNGGMVTACKSSPGCVAYIGISYLDQATAAGLGYAELQNKSGNYVAPTTQTIAAAAESFADSTPASGAISMIYGPASQGYPIVNYEYA
ncbi:MAG TPA: phosphate ABC transporter substrate-binding protein PstS, partial [Acidimicrobiales bacterium]|nr:phosphate ABC transporter substrate-binding protein PstS [Acidimicrobiales bacterium]